MPNERHQIRARQGKTEWIPSRLESVLSSPVHDGIVVGPLAEDHPPRPEARKHAHRRKWLDTADWLRCEQDPGQQDEFVPRYPFLDGTRDREQGGAWLVCRLLERWHHGLRTLGAQVPFRLLGSSWALCPDQARESALCQRIRSCYATVSQMCPCQRPCRPQEIYGKEKCYEYGHIFRIRLGWTLDLLLK